MAKLVRKISRHIDPFGSRDPIAVLPTVVVLGCEPQHYPVLARGAEHTVGCKHVCARGPCARVPDRTACESVARKVEEQAKGCGLILLSGVDDVAVLLDRGSTRRRLLILFAVLLNGECPMHTVDHFAAARRLRREYSLTEQTVGDIARDAWMRFRVADAKRPQQLAIAQLPSSAQEPRSHQLLRHRMQRLADLPETVNTLRLIARNLLAHGADSRYGTIQASTERFQRTLGRHHDAMRVLRSVGFEEGPQMDADGVGVPSSFVHRGPIRADELQLIVRTAGEIRSGVPCSAADEDRHDTDAQAEAEDGDAAMPVQPLNGRRGLAAPRRGSLLPSTFGAGTSPNASPRMRWRPSIDRLPPPKSPRGSEGRVSIGSLSISRPGSRRPSRRSYDTQRDEDEEAVGGAVRPAEAG
eukprot:TRINITY_DN6589_c0_g1_i1.p1 TRINITY_DN6589_c0_g1~~TRINITY_DN6589_c0_g1_i1.p1  ORF type:complete len:437 (+),score=125.91 TRINITY_DN6589_c0_g1_i1:77-1312(+)